MTLAQRVGARMKAALDDSGKTATEVKKALGYSGKSTLHRWFTGQTQPAYDDMAELGRLTGKPFSWFFRIDEESEGQAELVLDALVTVLYRMLSGEDPGDALVGEIGDPAALSPATRRLLEETAPAAREELAALTGGWLALPPVERRQRLRRIVNSYLDPDAM